jgi:hypothetical protein
MARRGVAVAGLVVVGLVAVGGYAAIRTGLGPLPDPEGCRATALGHTVSMSTEQAENAALIAAVAERRGLPARAISIAIATAYQESKLENVAGGDRDSLGLFQQRPSQGWGTARQVMRPTYAANAFYDALVKVDGYTTMDITQAAQAVQHSAYPDAYADHEADGRTIASALSGYSHAAFSCVADAESAPHDKRQPNGLVPAANAVRRDLHRAFGRLSLGGFASGGVSSGHMAGSAHYEGRAIDVFFRPISGEEVRRGWALAQYLVANANRLHVAHVIFDRRIWSAGSLSSEGWRDYVPPDLTGRESPATLAVLEHRDHVHVGVW